MIRRAAETLLAAALMIAAICAAPAAIENAGRAAEGLAAAVTSVVAAPVTLAGRRAPAR